MNLKEGFQLLPATSSMPNSKALSTFLLQLMHNNILHIHGTTSVFVPLLQFDSLQSFKISLCYFFIGLRIIVNYNLIQELGGKKVISFRFGIETHCHAKHLPLLFSLGATVCSPLVEVDKRKIPDLLLVENIPRLRIMNKEVSLNISIRSSYNKMFKEAHSHL